MPTWRHVNSHVSSPWTPAGGCLGCKNDSGAVHIPRTNGGATGVFMAHSERVPRVLKKSAEIDFLKSEVLDLERVIKSLHENRTDQRHEMMLAEERVTRASDEKQQWRTALEQKLHEYEMIISALREERAGAVAAAASREAETHMLTVELRLLRTELFDAEAEREAARASEASALSVARSYRCFAAQGAGRLEELRTGIDDVQSSLQQRLTAYQRSADVSLRTRALRAVFGWHAARSAHRAFGLWVLLVLTAEQREVSRLLHSPSVPFALLRTIAAPSRPSPHPQVVQARLEMAYRYRDLNRAQQQVTLSQELQIRASAAEADAASAREECARALGAAEEAEAKTAAVVKLNEELTQQVGVHAHFKFKPQDPLALFVGTSRLSHPARLSHCAFAAQQRGVAGRRGPAERRCRPRSVPRAAGGLPPGYSGCEQTCSRGEGGRREIRVGT